MRFGKAIGKRTRREALQMSRAACRDFALARPWENSARQFISHMNQVAMGSIQKPRAA
jgi:hypothetical protein